MTISASIVADSISKEGWRLTTFLLRYPRFIHAELMTHRVFSRNASSSRAIPVKKLISDIRKDPAMFEFWGRNQKGMQASSELEGFALHFVQWLWLAGMWIMTTLALLADKAGAHKQTVNRMVEPWSHITVVVTSTDYGNWFALRDHPDAQPEIMWLARYMQEAYLHNRPKLLKPGEWHLPFVAKDDSRVLTEDEWQYLIKVSVARCARTSYKTHDNRETTYAEDAALFKRLIDRAPLHASPAEHQATPDVMKWQSVTPLIVYDGYTPETHSDRNGELRRAALPHNEQVWMAPEEHGNFTGWRQFRKTLTGENQADAPGKYLWMAQDA